MFLDYLLKSKQTLRLDDKNILKFDGKIWFFEIWREKNLRIFLAIFTVKNPGFHFFFLDYLLNSKQILQFDGKKYTFEFWRKKSNFRNLATIPIFESWQEKKNQIWNLTERSNGIFLKNFPTLCRIRISKNK